MPELQKTAEIDSYHYGFISVFLFYVGGFMMFIMIDNYDSFVYNLSAYFQELGQDIKVIRNDKVTINELKKIEDLSGIIISPGPGNPKDGGISEEVIKYFCNKNSYSRCMFRASNYWSFLRCKGLLWYNTNTWKSN